MQKMCLLERKEQMDRIDKVLLILPVLPVADLSSTLFSLNFGGEEVGILARPILENYGPLGLVLLSASASLMFLALMQVVLYIKKLFIERLRFRWMWQVLAFPIYWIFLLEGLYVSTVISNLLVPLSFQLTETVFLRVLLVCTYFACISGLTISEMRQLPHFLKKGAFNMTKP